MALESTSAICYPERSNCIGQYGTIEWISISFILMSPGISRIEYEFTSNSVTRDIYLKNMLATVSWRVALSQQVRSRLSVITLVESSIGPVRFLPSDLITTLLRPLPLSSVNPRVLTWHSVVRTSTPMLHVRCHFYTNCKIGLRALCVLSDQHWVPYI